MCGRKSFCDLICGKKVYSIVCFFQKSLLHSGIHFLIPSPVGHSTLVLSAFLVESFEIFGNLNQDSDFQRVQKAQQDFR